MTTNLTPTPLRSSTPEGFDDAYLRHAQHAVDMADAACRPRCTECGGRGGRPEDAGLCRPCWIASVRRAIHRRLAREAELERLALAGDEEAMRNIEEQEREADERARMLGPDPMEGADQ